MKKIIFTLLCIIGIVTVNAQTPAFPGAEGGGKYVTGGRGGTVYYVNTLDDTNTGNVSTREGSLRWCLGQSGARTIVFKVSGIIALTKKISITNGNVTIAGQTAPGDGICIKNYEVVVSADNVIIRYMRFRLGDDAASDSNQPDALWGRYKKNIIIDHCSVSWSIDECSSFYSNENFTMQWCYITESLNSSKHNKGDHGYGGIWGGKNASFHHNLLAHHNSRNPRFNGWKRSGLSYGNPLDEERVDYRNNVVYNWGGNSSYGGEAAGKYNMVANYYKAGAATSPKSRLVQISIDGGTTITPRFGQFYLADNYMYGYPNVTSNNWNGVAYDSGVDKTACKANEPFDVPSIKQHTAEEAFEKVLAYGGASLVRDAVDIRIADEVKNGTYTYVGSDTGKKGLIDSQNDVGGWPIYNSTAAPVDTDKDGIPDGWLDQNYPGKTANELTDEGYTYLEVYLNSLVADITYNQYLGAVTTGIQDEFVTSDNNTEIRFNNSGNNLIVKSEATIKKVNVYNLDGALVINKNINNTYSEINTNGLSKGVYIVKVIFENNKQASSKILK